MEAGSITHKDALTMEYPHLYAVVMAGGRGERFWPLGRRLRPKQLLSLAGHRTMLEDTVQRLFPLFRAENILVIANAANVDEVRRLLPIPAENVIGEPAGRDTAPCVALACGEIRRRDASENAVMAVFPADHLITPAVLLQEQLKQAAEFALRRDVLMTLGIVPHFAATGYGYIECGTELEPGFFAVRRFVEKPDAARAEEFVSAGSFWWNSGIFIWKVSAIQASFEKHCPELAAFASELSRSGRFRMFLEENFPLLPRVSIDRCVMEKSENAAVSPALFQWDDLGSWSALRNHLPCDRSGNCGYGRRLMLDSGNNVVVTDENHLVAAIGIRNLAIVHTPDATLVCPLECDQRVKELLTQLKTAPDGEKYL